MATRSVALVSQADVAASRGDFVRACDLLREAAALDPSEVDTQMRLAAMCRATGDRAGALAAAEAALAVRPLDFTALMLRAHLLESLGEPEADLAYDRALGQRPVEPPGNSLDQMIAHAEVRAQAYREATERRLAGAQAAALSQASDEERARLTRFGTNATRTTRVYHSEPTDFHYPGLREREFHERSAFPWLARLEDSTEIVAAELAAVMEAERVALVPYVQYPDHQPLRQWKSLNHSLDWSAIHLIQNGTRIEANARHCPQTMALLDRLPQPAIPGASPNAMFSLLAPGTRIPPHVGFANSRLVCHLPLIVPGRCWFRVGAETRRWGRGTAWVFDDTIEHEAANESDVLRVILIFDVWHPDLSPVERNGVAATIAAFARSPSGI